MDVDVTELEAHRSALTGHCYRMLGSAADADDAVQETIVRAWRSMERFEGRASLRTWLYRIATNVCLDALSEGARRMRPFEEGPRLGQGSRLEDAVLETRERTTGWSRSRTREALPRTRDPFELTALRQSIRLAFVAALQHLPPRQRAALLLTDVLGWSAAEVAECLEMTVAAVNSGSAARARHDGGRNGHRSADALNERTGAAVDRYVDAFQRYDVDALVSLLREDATFSMPPYTLWLQGPEPVRAWLHGPRHRLPRLAPRARGGLGRRPLRAVPRGAGRARTRPGR